MAQTSEKSNPQISGVQGICRSPLSNGHFFWRTIHTLTLVSTSLQRSLFWRTVHTLTLVSTSLQRPLCSVPKVAVVEKLNCIIENLKTRGRGQLLVQDLTSSFSRILKNKQPGKLHRTFCHQKKLARLFLFQGVKLSPNAKLIQVLTVVNFFPPKKHSRRNRRRMTTTTTFSRQNDAGLRAQTT